MDVSLPLHIVWEHTFLAMIEDELLDDQYVIVGPLLRTMLIRRCNVKLRGADINGYVGDCDTASSCRSGFLRGNRSQYMRGQHVLCDLIANLKRDHLGGHTLDRNPQYNILDLVLQRGVAN